MEGNKHFFHPFFFQCPEHAVGKVQTGGRRGNGAFKTGINGLVVFLVVVFVPDSPLCRFVAFDVGRQRHQSVFLQIGGQLFGRAVESDQDTVLFLFLNDGGGKAAFFRSNVVGVKADGVARVQAFGIFDERPPTDAVNRPVERHFHSGIAAGAVKAGGNNLGVVENQHVAFAENVRQVVKTAVGDFIFLAQIEQARRITRAGRLFGNQAAVQFKVKNVYFHRWLSFLRPLYYRRRLFASG